MEHMEKSTSKFGSWIKNSASVRMLVVGVLTLILLIPLSFIESLINERQANQENVVKEINEKWGAEVLLYGPILKVPYKTYTKVYKENAETKEKYIEKRYKINYLYLFPKQLDTKANLAPELRHRGIYNSVVYKGTMALKGKFVKPDFALLDIIEADVDWAKSKIIVQTSNLKGINNKVNIVMNNNTYSFLPKYSNTQTNNTYMYDENRNVDMHSLESTYIKKSDLPDSLDIDFSIDLSFNGSKQLRIIPIGEETTMNIKSDWKTPKFIGSYLPFNSDKVNDNGFDANWKVLNINRGFAQTFINELPDLQEFAFGVNLIIPIDQYQQSMRTAKYGYLVISLTFLVFFLFQSISKVDIHPFQYLMIGVALTLFYTLLLSISEHSNFFVAYLIAGISVILLISLYSKSILKKRKFAMFIAASLTALYTFIYVIIQLENYALLAGSIGLFIILAAVMFASRKIDWRN